MLENNGCAGVDRGSPHGLKARAPILPTERMRQGTGRRRKRGEIAGNVKRLNTKLGVVLVGGIAPSTHLDIQFSKMLFSAPVIKGIHT